MPELGKLNLKHIHLRWANPEKTILQRNVDYGWSWAEMEIANVEMAALLDTVEHDVCTMVVQNYEGSYLPENALLHISTMLPHKHRRIRLSVVVSQSSIARSIFRLLIKIYPRAAHIRFVNTPEEAYALIEQHFRETPS